MSAYANLEEFYGTDRRRLRSPEIDFGVWWRWNRQIFRLTYVEATGELIAVQLTPPELAVYPFGWGVIAGEPARILTLGIVPDLDRVEELLDGWADVCGQPDSLAWVAERVLAAGRDER